MGLLTIVAIASTTIGLVLIRKYREKNWGKNISMSSLKGQVYIITGANSGIGKETARQLLQRHATVIMGNRNSQRTEDVIKDIRKTTKNGEVVFYELDLASFKSIKQFAALINKNHARVDVLINNAGVAVPLLSNERTEENFEMNFGVNHLGHFLLTHLLLKRLKESAPSRIVVVASTLHEQGKIDFDDLNLDKQRATGKSPRMSPGYCNSKLANVYHARELAERLKNDKVDVRIVCPGFCYTGLMRYANFKWWQYVLFAPIAFLNMRTAFQGSQTVLFCATEWNLPGKSGDFYRNCVLYESKANFDPALQIKLWEKSLELVEVN